MFTITVRKPYLFFLAAVVLVFLTAEECTASSESKDRDVVQSQQKVYQDVQPVPRFDWSQDRDTYTQIYVLKNEARHTFTVFSSAGTGETRYMCPSIGYAIPSDTQLTNPLQRDYGSSGAVIEQAEPNGLFSSKNTDGTYALCVRPNGDIVPIYSELKLTTFPFAVRWNQATGMIEEVPESPSTATVKIDQERAAAAGSTARASTTGTSK